jgi:upstream stimulatory factor
MDMMDIAGKGKVHKHFLEDESEEDQDNLMEAMQYRVSNQPNEVPFRVISESETPNNSHTITTNVQAVLASPLNGQFYVIGSPSDVLGAVGQRQIAPRTYMEQPASSAKEERQGNRRATHNEVERRRRDNINNWIMKLGKLIPSEVGGVDSQGGKQSQSKGGILAKACEYLAETRNANDRLRDSLKNGAELTAENDRLNSELQRLQRENALLQQQIQRSHLKSELDFNM